MGQCGSTDKNSKQKAAVLQQTPRSSEDDEEELPPPRARRALDEGSQPPTDSGGQAPVEDARRGSAAPGVPDPVGLAAVRASVDDATCTALLALRMGRGSSVNGVRRESTDTDGSEPMRSRQTSRQGMLEPLPEAVTPTASLPGSMAGDALLKPTGPTGEAQQQPDTRGGDQTAQAARPSGGGGVPGRHDSNEALMKLLLPTDAKQGQTADARAPQIQA